MVSFRQTAAVVWTFLAFMVAAGLVLNLRYKPLGEAEAFYLDTWTGALHAVHPEVEAPAAALDLSVTLRRQRAELRVLEGLLRRETARGTCGSVRFAFPAEVTETR
jgi:hypothetical protein